MTASKVFLEQQPPRVVVLCGDRGKQARCRRALGLWGFDVRCTGSPERALELVARGPCAAVVVDLETPEIDGLGVVSAVRGHGPTRTLPLLALSDALDEAVHDLLRGSGCDRLLSGPFDPDSLAAQVESALARSAAHAA